MPPELGHQRDALLRDAELCVRCGACLPVCPTYALTRHEGDSPRGRLVLVQGLAQGALAPDAGLAYRLDGCLGCRACEAICPAQVPVTRAIRGGAARLRAAGIAAGWDAFALRWRARWAWLAARFGARA